MNLAHLLEALGLVALMELGDKTQLATLSLCSYGSRRHVLAGVLGGLLLATLVTVAVAYTLSAAVVEEYRWLLDKASALLFIAVGARLALTSGRVEQPSHAEALASSLLLVFLSELGDKTQLAVFSLAVSTGAWLEVVLGAMVAFTLVNGLTVLLGSKILEVAPPRTCKLIASAIMITVGALMLVAPGIL